MRYRARSLLACLVAAPIAVLVPLAQPAAASPARVLRSFTVREIGAPGMALVPPADGRLRGPGFTAEVTGVAWPGSTMPVNPAQVVPAPGDRLVVFALRLSESSSGVAGTSGSPAPVSADLTAGPAAAAVPLGTAAVPLGTIEGEMSPSFGLSSSGQGTGTFVAAVPIHEHAVDLVLSQVGFSQSFSLWRLRRLAPDPTVLYRDPEGTTVSPASAPSGHVVLAEPAIGVRQAAVVTTLAAGLTYFAPGWGGETAPGPSRAELVVQLEADAPQTSTDIALVAAQPLPPDRLVLHVPGLRPVTPTSSPMLDTQTSVNDDRLLDATYTFTVPADVTTAVLEITPGPLVGDEEVGFAPVSLSPSTIEVTRPTRFAFRFPPLPPVARQRPPRWPSAAALSSVTVSGASSPSYRPAGSPSGGGGLPWLILAAIVLTLVAAVAVAAVGSRVRRAQRR